MTDDPIRRTGPYRPRLPHGGEVPQRIFLASKRAVVTYAPEPETGRLRAWLAPGGTGNVVAEQAGYLDVAWIVSADSDDDHRAALENPDGMSIELPSGRTVRLHQLRHDR